MITLTNGAQIPENAVQLQTTAAIDGYYVTQPLRLVQYDETLPVAAVQLTYQNQPYTPPTGAELNVRMGKPDGTTVYNPCLGMDSSGIVYFAFTQQMTIVAGTGTLTVEITDSGVKNSAPIIAEIRPNPVPEGSIESADEFLTLQEILAEAEKWGQIVQANASNIQQVVDNLEDIQNAAENAQAAAASAAAAQQAAQEALGFRTFFSAVRPDSNGNLDPSRPMTVGPAASVEIESAGDRIQSVTALGFTQQAGAGDPSPTNVRALTNGGIVLNKTVFNGSENWVLGGTGSGQTPYFYLNNAYSGNLVTSALYSERYPKTSITTTNSAQGIGGYETTCYIRDSKYATVADFKAALQANPLTVWYATTDGTGSLYAPIILTSGEYRATCVPLTAPLCEGDSVVSWVRSGCDKVAVLDGSQSMSMTSDGLLRITVADAAAGYPLATYVASITPYQNSEGIYSPGNGTIVIKHPELSSVEAAQSYLPSHPLTVWYRSTNYTEADDIAVSLEMHQQAVLVLDGTENGYVFTSAGVQTDPVLLVPTPGIKRSTAPVCSQYTPTQERQMPNNTLYYKDTYFGYGEVCAIYDNTWDSLETAKAYLAAQYAAGTPVTIVYQLATPITYAHPAVVIEASTGDQLTYTVTGQSGGTVSVALKPFQDGGNAAKLDGLTLSALQNLIAPIGYTFEWAPVEGGPDLSTPAKVAAYFGFGTWAAYGAGQVLVGVDSGQTEFATVGQTGGEKTHTLDEDELPNVTGSIDAGFGNGGATAGGYGIFRGASGCFSTTYEMQYKPDCADNTQWASGVTSWRNVNLSIGGGQAHNNLQPYITVYRWQRVA